MIPLKEAFDGEWWMDIISNNFVVLGGSMCLLHEYGKGDISYKRRYEEKGLFKGPKGY